MDRVCFDYSLLIGRLSEVGITQTELARQIGMPRKELRRKLGRGLPFKDVQKRKICLLTGISYKEAARLFFLPEFDHNESGFSNK